MTVNACTIIARNYLAQARVLAESFLEHHPKGTFTTLLLDDVDREIDDSEPFRIVRPPDLGLDRAEFHRMAFIYSVLELSTAVKPWLLRTLLGRGDHAIYLDPDIQIFAPLDDIAELARRHSIVLTPHTTEPLPRDGHEPSDATILATGIFNLGFIAVGEDAGGFLDWWATRLRRECLHDPKRGSFVDQRWIDFVPALFEHHILRDPGCNVAAWNLPTRHIEWSGESYRVNNKPLRFFHFSGFDPRTPFVLSRYQGRDPRVLLADRPALKRLCQAYAAVLWDKGHRGTSASPYAFDRLGNGQRIDRGLRRVGLAALLASEQSGEGPPPDAFDPAQADEFLAWLGRSRGGTTGRRMACYARALYDVDPDALGARWARRAAFSLRAAGIRLRERRRALRRDERSDPGGVNVAGYFRAELGIGEAARGILDGLGRAEVPYSTVNYSDTASRQLDSFPEETARGRYRVNIVCVNADRLAAFLDDAGDRLGDGHTVGVWFWEVSTFPRRLWTAYDRVDEVWTGSEFAARTFRAHTSKPVLTVPLPVQVPPTPRPELNLSAAFSFLFLFDFLSVVERKNPRGAVEAFTRAFEPGEGPVLILKSVNGDLRPDEREELQRMTLERQDVTLIDGYVSAEERYALLAACDCYVSLHRGEGFGLTVAEAMAYGKPVIATAYSGNLDFMTDSNGYLVPYSLTPIPSGCDPYPVGGTWADPDVEAAARVMRRVVENPDEAHGRGDQAQRDMRERHSVEQTAAFLFKRLREIGCVPSRSGLAETREQGFADVVDVSSR